MPAWIALEVTREQLWLDHATVKTGGTIEPDLAKFISQDVKPEAVALVNQLIMGWRKTPTKVFRKLFDQSRRFRTLGITLFWIRDHNLLAFHHHSDGHWQECVVLQDVIGD